ncbi:MAG: RNA-binding transcriptional accessory protein [Muribaculaceae bacterium]|nr:RNA-binding transcriptional accessory protein [Muribaculaceae bacterium]
MANEHATIIAREYDLLRKHVNAVLRLLDDGATIPFIARYRKEATGSMDDVMVHNVAMRHQALSELDDRKDFILKTIKEQGKLTEELENRITETLDPIQLEDIYMPYKARRRSRASVAKDLGLEPLAATIMSRQQNIDLCRSARKYMSVLVPDEDSALAGASDIIAEWVADSEKARTIVRSRYNRSAVISSRVIKGKEDEGKNFMNYFDFSEPLRMCTSHRYLAMRRGENEGILKVNISIDDHEMAERLVRMFVKSTATAEVAEFVANAVRDGYKRLMKPSIENEVASTIKDRSDTDAIAMFADNVRQLLMAPPLSRKRVIAIDPGYRTGCKIACLDEQGNLMHDDVIYPCPPHNDYYAAADLLCNLVGHFNARVIAIGNGTAGRETERFVHSLQFPVPVEVFMVSESGASIYSASEIAREEFPDKDVTVRGAVSIGRRLIDPLAELVKIDTKSIGVGQYQHDVNQTRLRQALDYTVESCVNSVGINVNTASKELLARVSGIGNQLAANIVEYRMNNGDFKSKKDLMNVPRMGEKAFQQCAGFLRIPGAPNVLDNTGVHPERYELVAQIAADAGATVEQLVTDRRLLHSLELANYVTKTTGLPTLTDIVIELEKPGRDPRSVAEVMAYDDNVNDIADLYIGQELNGKVTNMTAFGVFIDIGLKENGLIHISQLSDRFISNPHEVVSVGQHVKVKVIDVDAPRRRIALTMRDVPQKF